MKRRRISFITDRNKFLPLREARMKVKTTLPLTEDFTEEIKVEMRKTRFRFTKKMIPFRKFRRRNT
jgi:hypothetical protein